MKRILCYGDSNTFGYDPVTGDRYEPSIRWTGQLQSLLGSEYCIIEEGCNGRTTVFTDPKEPWKNGRNYLEACLNSHKPLDMVILMLGTNDLKTIYGASPEEVAAGAETLVRLIQTFTAEKQGFTPKILLVSPIFIGEEIVNTHFRASFDSSAPVRSKLLAPLYKAIAAQHGCLYLNAADIAKPSAADSLHMMAEDHTALAQAFANAVKNNL